MWPWRTRRALRPKIRRAGRPLASELHGSYWHSLPLLEQHGCRAHTLRSTPDFAILRVRMLGAHWRFSLYSSRKKQGFQQHSWSLSCLDPAGVNLSCSGQILPAQGNAPPVFLITYGRHTACSTRGRRSGAQRGASENNFGQRFSVSTPCFIKWRPSVLPPTDNKLSSREESLIFWASVPGYEAL